MNPTGIVRASIGADRSHRAVVPLHLSANFVFEAPGTSGRYDYTRSGNPTRDDLAAALAEAEGGTSCLVTASGMAAVHVVSQLLRSGDALVAPFDAYGGCHRLFGAESRRIGFDLHWVDPSAPEADQLLPEVRPRILWLETPSNPLLRITDLEKWAARGREVGAIVVADNTFLSPANQRPLDFGVDVVVHSTTKLINGHSDVVGGAIVCRDAALGEELAWWTNCVGAAGAPFDAYQTLRGLRTLHARVAVHDHNTLAVVDALEAHPAVVAVHHPSRAAHPGHEIAARQQTGWGSIVGLELVGGAASVERFVGGLRHFTLAESLGGVESLVAHPATMTHASMTEEARARAGIGPGLVRLSVGIERERDLVADVTGALDRVEEALCAPR